MAVTRADGADFDAKMAGADLSAATNLGLVVKYGTDERMTLTTAATDWPAGVITECANTDYPLTFQHHGLAKCVSGAAILAGAKVSATAGGKIITSAGGIVFGVARSAVTATDQIVEVYIDRQ